MSVPVRTIAAVTALLFATVAGASAARAATGPYLVKNIRADGGSFPDGLTPMGDILFSTADDGVHGRELGGPEGTAAGTWMVKDIRTGPEADYAPSWPVGLTPVGSLL